MEKRSKIVDVDGEIMLPEPLIQHIQSFLTGKEAARTTVLSKPWNSAWLTRPNLEFDQRVYRIGGRLDRNGFHRFAKKTMERYEQLNLKIESLKLFANEFYIAEELIVKAMEMGAVDLNFGTALSPFALPNEVLESQNLIRLSVTGCHIYGKTTLSSLESLTLCRVVVESDIICDIISRCPLLEQLLLSECKSLNHHSFKSSTRMLAMNHSFINMHEFSKLKFLLLDKVKISSLFFSNFSFRFPLLKYLLVHHCFGYKDIQIHSPSLEYISFEHKKILRAKFDVPRIRMFKFSGSHVPSLSFERVSSEWKSDIYISWKRFKTSCFLKLNKFLRELRQSKISLSLIIGSMFNLGEGFRFPEDGGLPKPVVEMLLMVAMDSLVTSALMDGLFWCFHPKCMYQSWMPRDKGNNGLLELLCKTLIQEGSENCCIIPNHNRRALHDLEQVSVDVFEDSLEEFQPLPWKMLFDASVSPENRRIIRFELEWGLHSSTIQ